MARDAAGDNQRGGGANQRGGGANQRGGRAAAPRPAAASPAKPRAAALRTTAGVITSGTTEGVITSGTTHSAPSTARAAAVARGGDARTEAGPPFEGGGGGAGGAGGALSGAVLVACLRTKGLLSCLVSALKGVGLWLGFELAVGLGRC